MARYTGPKCRLCRREGMKLYLKGERCYGRNCAITKRGDTQPPGMHVRWRRGGKVSEFGMQLRERQRLKRMFGILEAQFRRSFQMARRLRGNTGQNLLELVQRRLDHVIRMSGLAYGPSSARQVVSHGLVKLNGRRVDVPSILVKAGDVITVASREKPQGMVKRALESSKTFHEVPEWLERDEEKLTVKVLRLPTREEFPLVQIREQLIVEGCSK